MSRLIDADALMCKVNDSFKSAGLHEEDFHKFKRWVNKAPTIDAVSVEWIPCEERLPNRQGHYICTCKDGSKYKRTTIVKWSNGWQLTGSRAYWIVLAWMPLPEPWKGADDECDE